MEKCESKPPCFDQWVEIGTSMRSLAAEFKKFSAGHLREMHSLRKRVSVLERAKRFNATLVTILCVITATIVDYTITKLMK